MKPKTQRLLFNIIKYGFIHTPALIISMIMVIDTMIFLTDKPGMRWFFGFIAVTVELSFQYFRGMARLHLKLKLPRYQWKVGGFWLCISVYMVMFAFLSAVAVFMGEVNTVEQKQETAIFTRKENQAEYERVKREITRLESYRDEEKETGRGPEFKRLEQRIGVLESKRDNLKRQIESVPETLSATKESPFLALNQATGINVNWFKIGMFGAALMLLYTLLLITPWELPKSLVIHDFEKFLPAEKIPATLPVTPVTGDVIGPETTNDEPSESLRTIENKGLSDDQQKFISYVDELYQGVDDWKIRSGPVELNSLLKVRQNLRGIVSDRKCRKYKEILNSWGAIVTNNGVNSLGMWPKAEIIEKIREG